MGGRSGVALPILLVGGACLTDVGLTQLAGVSRRRRWTRPINYWAEACL